MNTSLENGKITAIWLTNGKQIDTTAGYILNAKGIVVRSGSNGVLVITPASVVSMKLEFDSKESVDIIFNGVSDAI